MDHIFFHMPHDGHVGRCTQTKFDRPKTDFWFVQPWVDLTGNLLVASVATRQNESPIRPPCVAWCKRSTRGKTARTSDKLYRHLGQCETVKYDIVSVFSCQKLVWRFSALDAEQRPASTKAAGVRNADWFSKFLPLSEVWREL